MFCQFTVVFYILCITFINTINYFHNSNFSIKIIVFPSNEHCFYNNIYFITTQATNLIQIFPQNLFSKDLKLKIILLPYLYLLSTYHVDYRRPRHRCVDKNILTHKWNWILEKRNNIIDFLFTTDFSLNNDIWKKK